MLETKQTAFLARDEWGGRFLFFRCHFGKKMEQVVAKEAKKSEINKKILGSFKDSLLLCRRLFTIY